MARDNRTRVYLGYEDEYVGEKYRSLVNFRTNKIGGLPDWHDDKSTLSAPQCRLCGLRQLLALQLYAPLHGSEYHRTLYVFACINPNCWNQNESWSCLRVQSLEAATGEDGCATVPLSSTSWLADADDWDDNWNDNASERNGNNLNNEPSKIGLATRERSFEGDALDVGFAELRVDDPNANSPVSTESPVGGGAVGRLDSPHATAEIEGEESEVVCIDTPMRPQCDLVSLLQEVTPLPVQHTESNVRLALTFAEVFVAVDEEDDCGDGGVPQHVRDLYQEYQRRNPEQLSDVEPGDGKGTETNAEKYERGVPAHGDEMFHNFLSRIQINPGQILRYSRDDAAALLLYPMSGCIGRCRHCGDEMTFELQILPTIIPKLRLDARSERNFQIEFGTVLIYTCLRSCWSATDSYREEHVIVQAERL